VAPDSTRVEGAFVKVERLLDRLVDRPPHLDGVRVVVATDEEQAVDR
jgi:hypothetical protein